MRIYRASVARERLPARSGMTRERVAATNRECAAIGLAAKPQR
jgi:hypothetical protein